MNKYSVRIKKLDENAIIPTYGSEFAAGADLYACTGEAVTINPHETKLIHTGIAMEIPNGKYAWMVKIGEKGQFVIPKEARELFDLQPGYEILVLGDAERGIAILPRKQQQEMITRMFPMDEEA